MITPGALSVPPIVKAGVPLTWDWLASVMLLKLLKVPAVVSGEALETERTPLVVARSRSTAMLLASGSVMLPAAPFTVPTVNTAPTDWPIAPVVCTPSAVATPLRSVAAAKAMAPEPVTPLTPPRRSSAAVPI